MWNLLPDFKERVGRLDYNSIVTLAKLKEILTMAANKEKQSAERRPITPKRDSTPDDFPDELSGEFTSLPRQTVENVGTIAGLAVSGGGYFGLSVTDDGGSVRLAVRNGAFVLDKRFSTLAKFEGALAYCLRKLE